MRLNGTASRRKTTTRMRACMCVLALMLMALTAAPLMAVDWPMFGQNTTNTGSNTSTLQLKSVSKLQPKWVFTTGGDVSARAAVVQNVAYFPDWGGNVWAVNAQTGVAKWSHQLSDYFPGATSGSFHSRTTVAVVNSVVYIGTQEGAWVLALKAGNGAMLWKTQVESVDPFAMVTTSPAVSGGLVYTGVASAQEDIAAFPTPGFVCCSGRGSVVALNAKTGAIVWKTYTVPTGYSGGDIWGSSPVVDTGRNSVFIGTGNNFSNPTDPAYVSCISGGGTAAACISPDDHVDSILSLNAATGAIQWATRLVTWNQYYAPPNGSDFWNVSCFEGDSANCPTPNTGPDYDFGSGPNEITYQTESGPQTIIGAGQKSGIYYALNPDTGAVNWQTQVGPGSSLGGMEWGSASDGVRIYVAISNFYGLPNAGGNAGAWFALDPATGDVLWQTADPNGAVDIGPMAVANGVVYAGSMSGTTGASTMFAMDASSGTIHWGFPAGSSVNCGATIVDGVVYWGAGYTHLGIPGFTGNTRFYAFSVNGNK
jgi:polyvinyl alcohol dehydrogenase (cytochrome)